MLRGNAHENIIKVVEAIVGPKKILIFETKIQLENARQRAEFWHQNHFKMTLKYPKMTSKYPKMTSKYPKMTSKCLNMNLKNRFFAKTYLKLEIFLLYRPRGPLISISVLSSLSSRRNDRAWRLCNSENTFSLYANSNFDFELTAIIQINWQL